MIGRAPPSRKVREELAGPARVWRPLIPGGPKIGLAYTRAMERKAPWFRLIAVVLVAVGLLILATPPPAQAFDPQLALALASAAGAIALITAYLIVANTRDKQRAASVEGIYFCGQHEADGPMGCGGPRSGKVGSRFVGVSDSAPEAPMADEPSGASRAMAPAAVVSGCPGGQASGPMGCGAGTGSAPIFSASAPTSAPLAAPAHQGQ